MKTKASAAADRNTNALTIRVELPPPDRLFMNSKKASMSDPEVAHLVHDDVAGDHPRGGETETPFGQVVLDDRAVEVRRHDVDQAEHRHGQPGQEDRREFAFRRERLDLAPHLEAQTNDRREVREDLAQVTA